MTELERVREELRWFEEKKEWIVAEMYGGQDGWERGVGDWMMEEVLILQEQKG